jgi:hypothetical protein
MQAAERMLRERAFHGAVISIDCAGGDCLYNLSLLDKVRNGLSASPATIPIAVMVDQATTELMYELRERQVASSSSPSAPRSCWKRLNRSAAAHRPRKDRQRTDPDSQHS